MIGGGGLSPSVRRQLTQCVYYETIQAMIAEQFPESDLGVQACICLERAESEGIFRSEQYLVNDSTWLNACQAKVESLKAVGESLVIDS